MAWIIMIVPLLQLIYDGVVFYAILIQIFGIVVYFPFSIYRKSSVVEKREEHVHFTPIILTEISWSSINVFFW